MEEDVLHFWQMILSENGRLDPEIRMSFGSTDKNNIYRHDIQYLTDKHGSVIVFNGYLNWHYIDFMGLIIIRDDETGSLVGQTGEYGSDSKNTVYWKIHDKAAKLLMKNARKKRAVTKGLKKIIKDKPGFWDRIF